MLFCHHFGVQTAISRDFFRLILIRVEAFPLPQTGKRYEKSRVLSVLSKKGQYLFQGRHHSDGYGLRGAFPDCGRLGRMREKDNSIISRRGDAA